MLERILVPLDGSAAGAMILEAVRPLARLAKSETTLFHAAEAPLTSGMDSGYVANEVRLEAEKYLGGLRRQLQPQGFHADFLVRIGPAAEVILDAVNEKKATMVAIATHGRTGLARLAFGSVAEKVLHGSPVPVLLLRSAPETPRKPPDDRKAYAHILVPVDGSDLALTAAAPVAEIARTCGSHVVLFHALPPEPARSESLDRAQAVFAAAKQRFADAGVQVEETMLRSGDPATEILDAMRERDIGLIAMSSHGRTGLARLVLGSVAEKVVRGAWVPVLVVPQKRQG